MKTIDEYLQTLPKDRREAIETVRKTVKKSLPKGYEEAFNFGMISWQVPLYLCNVCAIPSLKKQVAAGFKAAGKKLDMGKSCIRFKKVEDLPLDVIGQAIAATPMKSFVEHAKKSR